VEHLFFKREKLLDNKQMAEPLKINIFKSSAILIEF